MQTRSCGSTRSRGGTSCAIAADYGAAHVPGHLDDEHLIAQINDRSPTLRVVSPIVKQLACGDIGTGALADVETIVRMARELLDGQSSPPRPSAL